MKLTRTLFCLCAAVAIFLAGCSSGEVKYDAEGNPTNRKHGLTDTERKEKKRTEAVERMFDNGKSKDFKSNDTLWFRQDEKLLCKAYNGSNFAQYLKVYLADCKTVVYEGIVQKNSWVNVFLPWDDEKHIIPRWYAVKKMSKVSDDKDQVFILPLQPATACSDGINKDCHHIIISTLR